MRAIAAWTPDSSAIRDVSWAMTARLPLQNPHRPFNAMPVVVVFDAWTTAESDSSCHVPTDGPFLNGQPDSVAMTSEFAI